MAAIDSNPVARIELSIECYKLTNKDVLSKSDPQVTVEMAFEDNVFREIGRTEIVRDNLSPKFSTSILTDYFFERKQTLRFSVHDVDADSRDFIGDMQCSISDIMGSRGEITKDLHSKHSSSAGKINVKAIEVKDEVTNVTFHLAGHHLDKKDFLGKSDPYVSIYRVNKDGSKTLAHKTEVIQNTLDPKWAPFTVPLTKLNQGDPNRPIIFECYDWDKVGEHDLIGVAQLPLAAITNGATVPLINAKKQAKKGNSYQNSGELIFHQTKIERTPTFNDYLIGGTEISVMVAVDFTGSNGDPSDVRSLHFRDPAAPNQYASAIMSVCDILAGYDSDNKFPVLGFGAKIDQGPVNHAFNLTFDFKTPEVFGVQGILNAYYRALDLPGLKLSGPTHFAPIIRLAADRAKEFYETAQDVQAYLVLLILTDGEVNDMSETARAIIDASGLPMSIIIVGVGNADFEKMETLDGDDGALRKDGRYAQRDIVQFVPFRKYVGQPAARLAAEVLAEVPRQFMGFMSANKVLPRPPPTPEQLALLQAKRNQVQQNLMTQYGSAAPVWGAPPPVVASPSPTL